MGRSKFPGKPSKHTHKKRIHVLPANGDPRPSTMNNTNNVDGSSMTVDGIVENNKQKLQDGRAESATNWSIGSGSESSEEEKKQIINDKVDRRICASARNVLKGRLNNKSSNGNKKNTSTTRTNRKMQVLRSNKTGKKKRNLLKTMGGKCTRASTNNGLKSQKEALVGKFVLPTRSVHSSRVIKPNKRFINVDLNESVTSLKKKVKVKRHLIQQQQQNNNAKLNNNNNVSSNSSKNDDNVTRNEEESQKSSAGKVVIRQARLKLMPNSSSITSSKNNVGPFSTSHLSNNYPGTITCGVCGAVRFYRFVKQARKFNIYSCESCRKFISKMIKRQKCGKTFTLVCHKGQGMCHVPPIVRSQQWKLLRCVYASRCPACWLKMCLRSFQIPATLKQNLLQLLPKNMQGSEAIFTNILPPLIWPNPANLNNNNNNVINNDNKINSHEKQSLNNTNSNIPTTSNSSTTNKQQRPVRKTNVPMVKTNPNSDIKRQKIDLKGPRVKHVCRSASIVLGQPLATFCTEKDTQDSDDTKCTNSDSNSSSSPSNYEMPSAVIVKEKLIDTDRPKLSELNSLNNNSNNNNPSLLSETDSSDSDRIMKMQYLINEATVSSVRRREKSQKNLQEIKLNSERKTNVESQNHISIDFWEGYDPEDVCQNGFCLISSDLFPMVAICFLCGSAGRESLIYCSLCCEPYHSFCLEQQTQPWHSNSNIWLCPRCTKCAECNQTDRQKINCQKCMKSYHPECFNKTWNGRSNDDKPTVCLKCLRCKSCGSENITKFVGNLPLCLSCFKMRKKGNFCPICQHCYDDNECCSKMMECAKCSKWVHAKCEKLTEEQYQILSVLPESVEYFCKSCSTISTPNWRQAIELEFQSNCNKVLRMLSKNKTARNMVKWSPLSNHTPSNRAISNCRRLQFGDNCDIDNNNYGNKDNTITDVNKIYSFEENEKMLLENSEPTKMVFTMVDIKNKLNSNEYKSVVEFHKDVEEALRAAKSEQLIKIYESIFHTVFPWFDDLKEDKSAVKVSQYPLINDKNILNSPPKLYKPPQITYSIEDNRICNFCKVMGDGLSSEESRLLHCGQNEWVHANCALWSSEVYEEIDGSLQNVHSALNRGRLIRCAVCKQKGASVGCCFKGCYETYHFLCARKAKCHFLHDKTVYCAMHELPKNAHVLTSPSDFHIHRSVYVELDKKKRKYSPIDKVNFMVGSLHVRHLGKIHPLISDTTEAIIPLGFICTRLFWSTVEPWKLVQYTITTSVVHANANTLFVDKNFTIDHTLPKAEIEKTMKELSAWQRDIDRKRSEIQIEFEDDEEPQNGAADLLSPELTDAILEELPHDLLDGISVQDIFPKFMTYDELINMDFKPDNTVDVTSDEERNGRELKRSKSEVMTQHFQSSSLSSSCSNQNRAAQRSCSLTVSCKVDSALALPPAIKKRKIATRENNVFFQLLQVDGAFDESSSSECDSPSATNGRQNQRKLEEPVTCEKCQRTYRTQASYKRHLDTCEVICSSESDSEIIDDNHITMGDEGANQTTTLLFGSSSSPSTSSSSTTYQHNEISVLNTQQTIVSKSTELLTMQDGKSTVIPVNSVAPLSPINSQNSINEYAEYNLNPRLTMKTTPSTLNDQQTNQFCVNSTVPLCINQPLTIQTNPIINNNSTASYHQLSLNQGQVSLNQGQMLNQGATVSLNQATLSSLNQGAATIQLKQGGPITLNQGSGITAAAALNQPTVSLNPTCTVSLNQPVAINPGIINSMPLNQPIDLNQQSVTLPFTNTVTPILNVTPTITFNGKIINPIIPTVNTVNVAHPTSQWLRPIKPLVTQRTVKRPNNKSRTIAAKRTQINSNGNILHTGPLPSAVNQTTTPVILQHLPSTNFMPTFVDASSFQQQQQQQQQQTPQPQPAQNTFQYIIPQATISQPLIQIQDNNVINLVPGIQPTMFIQQQQNQLVLDSNGSLGWASTPTVQPVYYGFETIVQNTVMQSQQFLPTTVPGVLTANSSYSTTTQVFQTSKLEPVLDVASNSFVLVSSNSGQLVNNTPAPAVPVAATTAGPMPATTIDHIPQLQYSHSLINSNNTQSHSQPINIITQNQQELKYSSQSNKTHNTSTNNHIQLPTTPFVQEHGIPTNIVTPIQKPLTCVQNQNHRPMNRVLPMPTTVKDKKSDDNPSFDEAAKKVPIIEKDISKVDKIKLLSIVKFDESKKILSKDQDKEIGIKTQSTVPAVSMPSYSNAAVSFPSNLSTITSKVTLNSNQQLSTTITRPITTYKSSTTTTTVTTNAKTNIKGPSLLKLSTSKAVTVTPVIPVTKSEPKSMPLLLSSTYSPKMNVNSHKSANLNNSVSISKSTSCLSSSKALITTSNNTVSTTNSFDSIYQSTGGTQNVSSMKLESALLPSTSTLSSAISSAAISLASVNSIGINSISSIKLPVVTSSLSECQSSTKSEYLYAKSLSSSNYYSQTQNTQMTMENINHTIKSSTQSINNSDTVISSSNQTTAATMASIMSSKGQITLHKAPSTTSVVTAPALSMPLLSTTTSSNETNHKKYPLILEKPQEKENANKDTSLKLIFQKQGQDGTYKVSNNFSLTNLNSKQPLIAPLKPIKSNTTFFEKSKSEECVSNKTFNNNLSNNKKDESSILYTIETQDGFKYTSTSVSDLWNKVLEAVQSARAAHNMPPLPTDNSEGAFINSLQILGLKSSGLKYLIEQMPGASKCSKYKPVYNFPPHVLEVDDEYSMGHIHGAIRCCSYDKKKQYDMFGWLASKHRKLEEVAIETFDILPRRGSVTNLPMAMRFRQLKLTSKYSVGVYRSNIHGRGLFCLRDIEAGEMVIEYAGEVIRSVLTDKREKYYNSKGIGCYMFRVDDNFVVDATMKGNAARFINHSCDPNCYSKVVEILGHKHIIIFALRRILCGEELTYDYKFPFEEDKIPCTCGARKCRKFLN